MPPATHLHYLDGWRGLAIFFLLVGHFFPVPGINLGHVGVNLFFVLSGLLMARLLFVREVPLPQFYKRRIARIFPVVICFLAIIVTVRLAWGMPVDFLEVTAAAGMVNNYVLAADGAQSMPFGHFWSLCVEEHSYIVLSLIAIAARRGLGRAKTLVLLSTLAIAACGIYYWRYASAAQAHALSLHSEVAAFGIFGSAALALHFEGRTVPRLPALAYVALAGFGLAMHWWSVPTPIMTIVGVGAFALTINLLINAPASIHALLSIWPLRQLGLWSFSIYVWQQPFYLLSMPSELTAPLAVAAGVASYYLVERPAREWLNRNWRPVRASAGSVKAGVS